MNKFLAYGFVGACSAVVYFLSFTWFFQWGKLDYQIAVSIAYVLSVLVHFFMNRSFTFKSHGHSLWRHVTKYSVMLMVNYLCTLGIMSMVVSGLKLSPYLGIAVSIALTMGTGYIMAKFWVFNNRVEVK